MKNNIEAWLSDCLKGVVGALIVTIVMAMFQYFGAHIADILQFLSQIAGGIATIRIGGRR